MPPKIENLSIMKRISFCLISFLLIMAGATAQTQITSKVTEATVYLQGASLTQTADATLKAGSQEVVIEGLSPYLEISSLKVHANGVLVASSEFSQDFITPKRDKAHIAKLKDSLKLYEQQLQTTKDELTVHSHLLKMLTDGTMNNMSQKDGTISVADINANMELYKSKAGALQKSIDQTNKKISELQQTIQRINKQITQDETNGKLYSGILKLSISVPKAIATTFTITYYTGVAAWSPCYDINIDNMEESIALHAKAQVQQHTGLDWENVRLTLSNATPNRSTVAPVFTPWYLRFNRTSSVRLAKVENSVSYDFNFAQDVAEEIADEEPMVLANGQTTTVSVPAPLLMNDYIEEDMQSVHVNYKIAVPYNIDGNGKTQLIDLKDYTVKAEYKYYSIPKLSDETYLVASLSDYMKHNLLPGYATVTFDNTFVGKTMLKPNVTDSIITLTLTTDPRIAVKREKRNEFCSTKHVGNSTTATQSYLITVKNNQNKEVKLTLKEQYPISTNKDIEVKVTEVTPAATYDKKDLGVLTWDMDLKAGETRTFTVTYSVKYPKDQKINL